MKKTSIQIKIKGCSFDHRQEHLRWLKTHPQAIAWLEREKDSPFDPNAIRVMISQNGQPCHIGYIDRTLAITLAPIMDHGKVITIDNLKIIGGENNKHFGCLANITWINS